MFYTFKRSGKKQNDDTFETKFVRHVSVAQQQSSDESRIKLKLHLKLHKFKCSFNLIIFSTEDGH